MGVERVVTRWYLQRQCILNEITLLQAELERIADDSANEDDTASTAGEKGTSIQQQLIKAQGKLHTLGPCPKAMMG
jgi:hypothetical protein